MKPFDTYHPQCNRLYSGVCVYMCMQIIYIYLFKNLLKLWPRTHNKLRNLFRGREEEKTPLFLSSLIIPNHLSAKNSIRSSFNIIESKELELTRLSEKNIVLPISVTHYLNNNNTTSCSHFIWRWRILTFIENSPIAFWTAKRCTYFGMW